MARKKPASAKGDDLRHGEAKDQEGEAKQMTAPSKGGPQMASYLGCGDYRIIRFVGMVP